MVGTPEADDCKKIMNAHAMIGEKGSSWAITCKKLLEDNIRVHGVKLYNKHSKRETKQNMEKDILSSRYGGCTHDKNEEESCGSR